jgi:glycosyltransferase involved in cell wall biosynthesis
MKRVLSLATLYPNAARPTFGTFVARQMEALAARDDWAVTVVNPIGTPPLALGRYADLARAAVDGSENGVTVLRPRFALAPALSARWNPTLIARAVLPFARRLHAAEPFDIVDAQFFWPDGPAAAAIARALGLPLSIKARGADIHHWGAQGFARRRMLDAAGQAEGLLAVSQALKSDMVALGMRAAGIAVQYTGIDRLRFHPRDKVQARTDVAARFGIPAEGPLLATVGALIPRKGQALTMRALAMLGGETQLAVVGAGPDEAMLRRLAAELGVAARVHFLGAVGHAALPELLARLSLVPRPGGSPRATRRRSPRRWRRCWRPATPRMKSRGPSPGSAGRRTPPHWPRITRGCWSSSESAHPEDLQPCALAARSCLSMADSVGTKLPELTLSQIRIGAAM